MATGYKWGENYKACRLQLDFLSFVKFTTFVGLCFGVASIPLVLLFDTGNGKDSGSWIVVIPLAVLLTPIVGAVNGALQGAWVTLCTNGCVRELKVRHTRAFLSGSERAAINGF